MRRGYRFLYPRFAGELIRLTDTYLPLFDRITHPPSRTFWIKINNISSTQAIASHCMI